MAVLVYAVYAKTPLGAIAETGINVARGQKERPSWLATFKGRETAVTMPVDATTNQNAAEGDLPPPIIAAAVKHKVDPEAVASLLSTHGTCTAAACTMDAPPRASAVLASLAGKTTLDADDVAQALAAGQKDLENNAELAIEALWIGPIPTKLAVEQARRSNLADAVDVEAHADFLTPTVRRGALQGALAVLAVYRLRTLAWPADPKKFRVTSPFGERIDPVNGSKSFHNGTDIGVPSLTPLMAAHNGRVKRQSQDSMSGNYVILDHGLGLTTVYCHMTQASVVEGARVKRKEVVGLSGATGRVTGPHLHYILRINDKNVDAAKYGESPVKHAGLAVELPAIPDKVPPKGAKPPVKGPKPSPTASKPGAKPSKPDATTTKPDATATTDAGPAPIDTTTTGTDAHGAEPMPAPPATTDAHDAGT